MGTYDIVKNIRMRSRFDLLRSQDDWLPCCSGGYASINLMDQGYLGKTTRGVFDCTCFAATAKAQFPRVRLPQSCCKSVCL